MSSVEIEKDPLRVRVVREPEELGHGRPIRALGSAQARLDLEDMVLSTAVPEVPTCEARFIVDQQVRAVAGLVDFAEVVLESQHSVDRDLLEALALDLYHRGLHIPEDPALRDAVMRVGEGEALVRSWVNEDPSTRTSVQIARDVVAWADGLPVETTVLEEPELEDKGLRLLLAVGQGSTDSPPRLVLAHYKGTGDAANKRPLALVGKGITFDTGGINVKPYSSFVSMMKNDMAGSALAFALFKSLVEAEFPEPLLLVLPTCENAVGEKAMRPGALLRSFSGLCVRVDHTDAEGRLVLADGLAYAQEVYDPRQFLCFATLTTAALNAYGPYATPVHFASQDFEQQLAAASAATGEDLHFFPKRIWHEEANRDREADLRNTARLPGNASAGAGSRNAAHFLLPFVKSPLCHFDIFASAWNWSGESPGSQYGATGAPFRTVLRALQDGLALRH